MSKVRLIRPQKYTGRPTKAQVAERERLKAEEAENHWFTDTVLTDTMTLRQYHYRCKRCHTPLRRVNWRFCPGCGYLNLGEFERIPEQRKEGRPEPTKTN